MAGATSRWQQNKSLRLCGVAAVTSEPACWNRVDLRVDLDAPYQTPFDPDKITVNALFQIPPG
jgi:hypothetical protein